MGGAPIYFLYKDLPTFNLQRMLSDVGIAITFSITFLSSFLLLTQIKLVPLVRKFFKACGSIPWKALFSRPLTKEPEESLPSLIASLQLTPPSSIKPLYPTQKERESEEIGQSKRKPVSDEAHPIVSRNVSVKADPRKC